MVKASDNEYPSVLVKEGSTPASPSSGDQRVFIDSADHKLKRVNSGGTVTTIESGGANTANVVSAAIFTKTSGNTTLSSNTTGDFDTGTDLTLAAAANDYAVVWINALHDNSARIVNLDVATIVSTPQHYFGAGLASSAQGLLGWSKQAAAYTNISGFASLQLVSGDISGGNVTLRLRYKCDNSGSSIIYSSSNTAFVWGAFVLRTG